MKKPIAKATTAAFKATKTKSKAQDKAKLEKACDTLWAQAVKKRDNYKCVRCGKPAVHAHHIFSRRHKRTRWEIQNGISLCFYEHWYWVKSSEPDDKAEYLKLLEKRVNIFDLKWESGRVFKPTIEDLQRIKARLESMI